VEKQAGGRRERRRERTRAQLLESALALFAERGIHGTRVQDITDAVDLGKGAFYNYFASKNTLIAELLHEGMELLEQSYLAELAGRPTSAERIVAIARGHELFFEAHPTFQLLFHEARGLLQVRHRGIEPLTAAFSAYLERLALQLLPEPELEHWTAEDRIDLAAVVVGAITGYRSFRIASGRPAQRRTAEEILAGGLPLALRSRRLPST
jgi:AcrR family transcriptional regulator